MVLLWLVQSTSAHQLEFQQMMSEIYISGGDDAATTRADDNDDEDGRNKKFK